MKENGLIAKTQIRMEYALWKGNSLELIARVLLTPDKIPIFRYILILIVGLISDFTYFLWIINIVIVYYITENHQILWWKIFWKERKSKIIK